MLQISSLNAGVVKVSSHKGIRRDKDENSVQNNDVFIKWAIAKDESKVFLKIQRNGLAKFRDSHGGRQG